MAAFEFSIEQISFSPEDIAETSSLDSLSSVVDPNVDFKTENVDIAAKETNLADVTEEWKTAVKYTISNRQTSNKSSMEKKDDSGDLLEHSSKVMVETTTKSNNQEDVPDASSDPSPSYPIISLSVANCMNENNPTLYEEAEKYLNAVAVSTNDTQKLSASHQNIYPSSPLHSMCITSEALALQQSVIGNLGVKPVSADIVAQVVESTKLRLLHGTITESTNTSFPCHDSTKNFSSDISNKSQTSIIANRTIKPELIRYPSDSISSTVEKRSWFSNSSIETVNISPSKHGSKDLSKSKRESHHSTSQNDVNSVGSKKKIKGGSNIPGVHSAKGIKTSESDFDPHLNFDSPYEKSLDNSISYETESSISEKYDVESLCSEAYETESNISDLSGINDEIFQFRKSSSLSVISASEHDEYEKRLKECGTQANAVMFNATTSPIRSVFCNQKLDKSTLTDEHHNFELMREKASLEGQLENLMKENSYLLKERDHFSSTATSLEAQLKSLENQLQTSTLEKKSVLKNLDVQTREHRNWDNIIKEYQTIIEAKNAEIKGVKDDLSESEQANIQAKVCYEELKLDMESRDGAVMGLKKKITELHVKVQLLLQEKTQSKNDLNNASLEMDMLRKSKDWYQDQLHVTQENRNKLHQQLISVQANEANQSNCLEKATSEIDILKQQLTETQQKAVKEKEVLMKHLETIEADMMERESMFEEIQKDKGSVELVLAERIRKVESEKSKLSNLSFTLSDLEHQLSALKEDNSEKGRHLKSIEKEKAQLLRQIVVLQKSSNEKDLNLQQLQQQIKDMSVKMSHTEIALVRSEELVGTLKEEKTAIDVALAAANEVKRMDDESLKAVGENLNKFKSNFKQMKAELLTKSALAEQLFKEKNSLEESVRKNEESLFFLKKEFAEKMNSENHNRGVMLDDMVKQKKDIQSILDVYSKDLLNYEQSVQNLVRQNKDLHNELAQFRLLYQNSEVKIKSLNEDNLNLQEKLSALSDIHSNIQSGVTKKCADKYLQVGSSDLDSLKVVVDYKKKVRMYKSNIKILSQKLKEKMIMCENLTKELKKREELEEKSKLGQCLSNCQFHSELLELQVKYSELERNFSEQLEAYQEQNNLLKKNENIIIELEREKGKATGLADTCHTLKLRATELETKLSEKDSQIAELDCYIKELNNRLSEQTLNAKEKLAEIETDFNKEKALVKSLRQQIFQEKRLNSQLQRQLSSQKSALEQTNQLVDSKKQELDALQEELTVKLEAELRHQAKEEQFRTEICLRQAEVDKLVKEIHEVKSRDPALAEQLKSLSWHLKEKSNEISTLKEKQKLINDRHDSEITGLKSNLQNCELELQNVKQELSTTRKEKFAYQTKVVELRKALKIKLGQLESKGILKVENKVTSNGSFIELNFPDPESSFDETYINSLLEKSMNLSESRPLSNLQECLNSLKEEVVQLQKKISADTGS